MSRKKSLVPQELVKGGVVQFPVLDFGLEMTVRVPTLTGDWEGSLATLLEIDTDNPRRQLVDASSLTAFWVMTKAILRKRALSQQSRIEKVRSRLKQGLLKAPPKDDEGEVIRMTKDNLQTWLATQPELEAAIDDLQQTEMLLEIAENIMWEFKSRHKSLQVLCGEIGEERGVERTTNPSHDPGRSRQGRGNRNGYKDRDFRLENQLGGRHGGMDDAEED